LGDAKSGAVCKDLYKNDWTFAGAIAMNPICGVSKAVDGQRHFSALGVASVSLSAAMGGSFFVYDILADS